MAVIGKWKGATRIPRATAFFPTLLFSMAQRFHVVEPLHDVFAHHVATEGMFHAAGESGHLVCRSAIGVKKKRSFVRWEASDDDLERVIGVPDEKLPFGNQSSVRSRVKDPVRQNEGGAFVHSLFDPVK